MEYASLPVGEKKARCANHRSAGAVRVNMMFYSKASSHDCIARNLQPPSPKSKYDKNESQSGGDNHASNQGHQMSTEDVAYFDITVTAICIRVRSAEGDPVIDRTV